MSCLPFWSLVGMHIFFFETEDLDKPYRAVYIHEMVLQTFILCRSLEIANGKLKTPVDLLPIEM